MSGFREIWRRAAEGLGRLLRETVYPEGAVCAGCGKTSRGGYLCPACREELMHSEVLASWESRELAGVTAWSMRPHRGLARELVLRLKHGTEAGAAEALAGMLRERPDWFPDYPPDTVVTWVPAPKSRIRERCIDHGQALACAVARELGLSCRPLLRRVGNDRPQARLSMERRQQNLRKAFEPAGRAARSVLLVDDVLTTGTTAKRCIAALRRGGAEEIGVLTATWAAGRRI